MSHRSRTDEAQHVPGLTLDERGGPIVGRRYALHEACHSTATLLMEAGVSNAVITAIIGRSSIASSQAYLHASQDMSRRAPDGVAGRLRLSA